MLRTTDLHYDLPEDLIAVRAAEPRDAARLMVLGRGGDAPPLLGQVRDLPRHLRAGDVLVLNTTRVLAARLEGVRTDTGGKVHGLFLHAEPPPGNGARRWVLMLRGKSLRPGVRVAFGKSGGPSITLTLLERDADEHAAWRADVATEGLPEELADDEVLSLVGLTPLPPYILKARRDRGVEVADPEDRRRYQTVFASGNAAGSVAAPTAGLHLTEALLAELDGKGVERCEVTLHVGTGTFKPVETEFLEQHRMHAERCMVPMATRAAIAAARAAGRRVICIGTTAARAVEACAARQEAGEPTEGWFETDILISPGHRWRWADGLLTNFHLPESTLLAMVASLLEGGVPRLLEVYGLAVRERMRFFSYGDAMLVLP